MTTSVTSLAIPSGVGLVGGGGGGGGAPTGIVSVTASRDALLTDDNKTLICNSTNAIDITIKNDATTLWANSEAIVIFQKGTGVSRFIADTANGVTFRGVAPDSGQYVTTCIFRVGPNEWSYA